MSCHYGASLCKRWRLNRLNWREALQTGRVGAAAFQLHIARFFNPARSNDPLSIMNRYDSIAKSDDPDLLLVAGSPEDRLAGLGPLLARARGCSILDVACHNGLNSAAFAEAGARAIDGFDFWRPGIDQARENLAKHPIPTRFAVCDLRRGLAEVQASLAPFPEEYDIVLYLGIHHHLLRQMNRVETESMATRLASLAKRYVAVRTPAHSMDSASDAITAAGFKLWYEDGESTVDGGLKVGGLRVFVRS